MKWMILLACVIAPFLQTTAEPLSPDEAAARLKEREASRATSQPSREEIDQLRREVARLRAENDRLMKELTDVKLKLAAVQQGADVKRPAASLKERLVGMTLAAAEKEIGGTAILRGQVENEKRYDVHGINDEANSTYKLRVVDGKIVAFAMEYSPSHAPSVPREIRAGNPAAR